MVSLEILFGLLLLVFVIPVIFFYFKLEEQRRLRRLLHTEKEHLRHMVRDMESHLRNDKSLFLEALGVPFLLMRSGGRVVMGNKPANEILGLDVARTPNLLKLLPEGALRSAIAELLKAEQGMTLELDLPVREENRHYVATATPLCNADRHIGIVFHDVTAEYRTKIIRRDFVANASHELRTPLTILGGYLETLIENPADADDAEVRSRALAIMRKHVERITHLVEDMLTVSRLENAQELRLKQEEFDFAEVVNDVVLRLDRMIVQQQVDLQVELSPRPFVMRGDVFYWSQIIFNLMENAMKNNPAAGLRLSVFARQLETGCVEICVEDSGVGIPADDLPFIFNRFYRGDAGKCVKGTGLGLSIVRHAVEAHGGSIGVSSTPGRSTLFRINLPPSCRPDVIKK